VKGILEVGSSKEDLSEEVKKWQKVGMASQNSPLVTLPVPADLDTTLTYASDVDCHFCEGHFSNS
jgi:hypothetical protein